MKKLKRNILYVFGTLFVMTACLLFSRPVTVTQAEEKHGMNSPIQRNVTIDGSGNDIPEEIKSPIKKGQMLAGWLVISVGGLCLLIGIFLMGFDRLSGGGHAGAGAIGIKVACVGAVLVLAPVILSWLLPGFSLTY